MLDNKGGEIIMKKYTKPTVDVVELSVKESLSALPSQLTKTQKVGAYTVTLYNAINSNTFKTTVTE